ncbi:MAG TPA: carbohydrate ABC transporter permease [Bauldia sp.]|nr:carbohydrate ABC transporter permease [Bauldia sp.]
MTATTADLSRIAVRSSRFGDIGAILLTILTIICAVVWFFPLYWALVTSFKYENDVLSKSFSLLPEHPTLTAYIYMLTHSRLLTWYLNSTIVAVSTTVLVVLMAACCGYAISQLRFPGRKLLWWLILASFMVPVPALIVNHFIIIAGVQLLNTYPGVVLPQMIAPVTIIIYKQFFDSVPRDFREAAVMDGASEFQLLFRIFLPMNWGVTTALAIVTFIGAWNTFLWPFLATKTEDMMTVTVGIVAVQDAFGVYYAKLLAGAVLAGLPVATAYLIFQRRVTQAITLSAGIKG